MALKHIEEAEELSRELGGTDKDVKVYFFSLDRRTLGIIFDKYGRMYGKSKQEYAEGIYPRWKSGDRKMSGLVASRLFSLLPEYMPLKKKYELSKNLWIHYGPKTNKRLRIGTLASPNEVHRIVEDTLLGAVNSYQIPDNLVKRFRWLSSGDVNAQQKLLNHFLDEEKQFVITESKRYIQLIDRHMKLQDGVRRNATHSLKVGTHNLELVFTNSKMGVVVDSPSISTSYYGSEDSVFWKVVGWVFWIVIGLTILNSLR